MGVSRVLLMVQWCQPSPQFLPLWNSQPSEDCKSNNHEITAGRDTRVISMKRGHGVPREPLTEGTLVLETRRRFPEEMTFPSGSELRKVPLCTVAAVTLTTHLGLESNTLPQLWRAGAMG